MKTNVIETKKIQVRIVWYGSYPSASVEDPRCNVVNDELDDPLDDTADQRDLIQQRLHRL